MSRTPHFKEADLFGTSMGNQLGLTNQDPMQSRKEKMLKTRKATNELQKFVIDYLNTTGQFKVWRNNNIPSTRLQIIKEEGKEDIVKVHYKKNQKTVSTLDIIGFRIKDGKHLEIEIKHGKDVLDKDQKKHLDDLQASGCISFAVTDRHIFMQQITPYMDERKPIF